MKVTQIFFQGFTITIKEKNGLYNATAISKQTTTEKVYGLSSDEAVQRCKLQIFKYFASTIHQPCIVVQDNYILHLNLAAQLSLATKQTAGLTFEKIYSELLNLKPFLQIVGLLESPPMRLITFK